MSFLHRFVKSVDAVNDWIGRTVAWLTLGCVLTCFTVVVLRYAFNVGFPWMQELYVWQHAAVFMAGAGYTMLHRGHVNVDVMYGKLGDRGKAGSTSSARCSSCFPGSRSLPSRRRPSCCRPGASAKPRPRLTACPACTC